MLSNYFDKHVKRTSVRNTENLNSEFSAHPACPKRPSDEKRKCQTQAQSRSRKSWLPSGFCQRGVAQYVVLIVCARARSDRLGRSVNGASRAYIRVISRQVRRRHWYCVRAHFAPAAHSASKLSRPIILSVRCGVNHSAPPALVG